MRNLSASVIWIVILIVLSYSHVNAQQLVAPGPGYPRLLSPSQAAGKLASIYKVYDSMTYMSFDVDMVMQTDTVSNKSHQTRQSGKITVAGNKFDCNIGDMEYYQSDSLSVSLYRDSKVLLLDRPRPSGVRNLLPGGGGLDSMVTTFSMYYGMSEDTSADGNMLLIFTAFDNNVPYKSIRIEYDSVYQYLYSTRYEYYERIFESPEVPENPVEDTTQIALVQGFDSLRRHTLTTTYSGYRFDPASFSEVFADDRFIRFDGVRYFPADPYRTFQFHNMLAKKEEEEIPVFQ